MPESTSGNWRYDRDFARVYSDAPTPDGDPMPVCDLTTAWKPLEEMHRNGALIAASKALLAACELWDQGFEEGEQFTPQQLLDWVNANRRAAREAIRKAKEG